MPDTIIHSERRFQEAFEGQDFFLLLEADRHIAMASQRLRVLRYINPVNSAAIAKKYTEREAPPKEAPPSQPARPQELPPAEAPPATPPPEPEPEETAAGAEVASFEPSGEAAPVAADGGEIASDNAVVALLEQVESVWEDVLQGIRARDRTLYVLLTSSGGVKPIDVKDDVIVFEVKNDWQVKKIEQPAPRRLIEGVLSKQMGANYRISCVAEAQHRENPNMRREQIRNSRKDPHVRAAINIFDADIVDVEQSP